MLYGDRDAFRGALAGLVRQAGSQALVSRVLVTAFRLGDLIQVGVTDDGLGFDRFDRRAPQDALRPIERLIALQGRTLEITSWPDQGAKVLMRWPESGPAERVSGE
jgi:signal transduction histidine kinase